MVSPLFTAFALIAAGRVDVPPPPAQPMPMPVIRGFVREEMDDEADRVPKRR